MTSSVTVAGIRVPVTYLISFCCALVLAAGGLALADRVVVLEKGRVALAGTPADIRADERLLSLYVGEADANPLTE